MNESMTLGMWGSVFGRLFLEVSLGVFVVGLAQGWVRSASWRRTLWMGTLLSSFYWLAIHLTDMEQRVAMALTPTSTAQRQVNIRADLEPSLALTGRFGKVDSGGSGIRPETSTAQIPPVVWPFWLWLTGVVGVGAWRLGGRILLTWAWRRGCWPSEREHAQFVSQLALKLGYRRRVRAWESQGVISPIAVGWIRPTVGLPAGFWNSHSAREKEAILAHELAHLSRRDPFWLGLADGVLAAFWWHPVLWWARRQLWQAAEQAADEASLWVEEGPVVLASCLLALAQQVQGPRSVPRLGMAGFRSGLGRRIERLLHLDSQQIRARRCRSDSWICLGASAAFVAMVMIATVWLMPQRVKGQPSLMSAVYQAAVPAFAADGPSGPTDRVKIAPAANSPQSIAVLESPAKDVSPASTNDPSTKTLATITAVSSETRPTGAELGLSNNTLGLEELPPASAKTNLGPSPRRARVFKLDPHIIKKRLVTLSGPATEEVFFNDMVQFLKTAGVDFSPEREDRPAIYFKEDTGLLWVNATETDLSTIEQAITFLQEQPPQIMLEARFVEIPSDAGRESEIDDVSGLGQLVPFNPAGITNQAIEINGLSRVTSRISPLLNRTGDSRGNESNWPGRAVAHAPNGRTTALLGTVRTGRLTKAQTRDVIKALEQQSGVDTMSAPRVTTLSGRQAQIAITEQKTVVTGINPEAMVRLGEPPVTGADPMLSSTVPVGITLDIFPEVEADGTRLRLTAIPSVVEFMGYDEPSKAKSIQVWDNGRKKTVKPPCPHFRVRQMETQDVLESGQTLMMEALPLTESQTVRGKKKSVTKRLLVFITATFVDPAGNPIVPPQRP